MLQPMLEAFSSEESKQGHYLIPQEVVRLELGIEDREVQNVMLFQGDWGAYLENIHFEYLIPDETVKRRREVYYKKFNLQDKIACWGYGDCFYKVFPMISRICPVAYVCDSDKEKWGEEYKECKVISPDELTQHHVSFVVITVVNKRMVSEISRQLASYGITSYCHINEWISLLV